MADKETGRPAANCIPPRSGTGVSMDFRVKSRRHRGIFKLQTNLVINVECTQAKRLAVFLQFQAVCPSPLSLSLFVSHRGYTWYKGDYLKHLNSLYELPKGPLSAFAGRREFRNFLRFVEEENLKKKKKLL